MARGQQDQAAATLLREHQVLKSLGKKTCVFETAI